MASGSIKSRELARFGINSLILDLGQLLQAIDKCPEPRDDKAAAASADFLAPRVAELAPGIAWMLAGVGAVGTPKDISPAEHNEARDRIEDTIADLFGGKWKASQDAVEFLEAAE